MSCAGAVGVSPQKPEAPPTRTLRLSILAGLVLSFRIEGSALKVLADASIVNKDLLIKTATKKIKVQW